MDSCSSTLSVLLPSCGLELSLLDEHESILLDHVARDPIIPPFVLLGDNLKLSLECSAEWLHRVRVRWDEAVSWKFLRKIEALGARSKLIEIVDGDFTLEGNAGGRLAGAEVDVEVAAKIDADCFDVDPEGALEAAFDGDFFEERGSVRGDHHGALGFFFFDDCC